MPVLLDDGAEGSGTASSQFARLSLEAPIYYYKWADVPQRYDSASAFADAVRVNRSTAAGGKRLGEIADLRIEDDFGSLEAYYEWVNANETEIERGNRAYDDLVERQPVDEATKQVWKEDPENLELNFTAMIAGQRRPTRSESAEGSGEQQAPSDERQDQRADDAGEVFTLPLEEIAVDEERFQPRSRSYSLSPQAWG